MVKALGLDGISKSEVSRICAELESVVEAFRTRPPPGEYPDVWVDATYHKVRVEGRVVSQATVVAIGVTFAGERQVLGVDVGASEDRRTTGRMKALLAVSITPVLRPTVGPSPFDSADETGGGCDSGQVGGGLRAKVLAGDARSGTEPTPLPARRQDLQKAASNSGMSGN